jgi:pyrimidine operon attenuation protein/uracil phosphoribosyltransferase
MSSLTLDAEGLYRELLKAMQLLMASYSEPPQLVGIASGGVWLAERLQADLKLAGKIGILSSAMHRDDFAKRGLATSSQTQLPFDVNGAHLMLVDDVLYTGRTLRAVINELFDYGRPASVKLVVLVDRGGRELPIQPDLAIARVALPAAQSLALARLADGSFSFEVQDK